MAAGMDKKVYGALSLIALIIGLAIYLFFRGLDMVLFRFLPKPHFLSVLFIPVKPSVFSSFLLYNLPDALWFLSGILFLRFAWFHKPKWQNTYIACFCGIALILETSQISKKIPGTFDVMDLFFMALIAFIEGSLYNTFLSRRMI
jgi:hypothetical protein